MEDWMWPDPRTAARRRAEQRRARDRAHDDLELLDRLLQQAEMLKVDVASSVPHLNTDQARARCAEFADLFDDCLGDTLAAARKHADAALDDATPAARPMRMA
jgi:hypothetical protein